MRGQLDEATLRKLEALVRERQRERRCPECGGAPSRGCSVHLVLSGEALSLCRACGVILTPRGPLPRHGKLIVVGDALPENLDKRRHRYYQAKGGAAELFQTLGARRTRVLIAGPAATGKTRACLEYINFLCSNYRLRVLVLRQTLQSLRESVQITYEHKGVVHEGHPVLAREVSLDHRRAYVYPTGSRIVLGGLDKPEKLFSTEYDLIFIFEAIETNKDSFEKLYRANRNHWLCRSLQGLSTEYFDEEWIQEHDCIQQIVADTNPGPRTHYLYQYAYEHGLVLPIESLHRDNPACTPQDLEKLRALTGVRRDRLYLGLWVGQSGLVWGNYNAEVHLISGTVTKTDRIGIYWLVVQGWAKPVELTWFVCGFDFGFSNPGCLQLFGVDAGNRMYRVAEVYFRERTIDWWAARAAELYRRYPYRAIVCDNARSDSIRELNDRIGPLCGRRLPSIAVKCDKSRAKDGEMSGIDQVRQRFERRGDGTYGLYFLRESFLWGRDQALKDDYEPACFEDEVVGWSYRDPDRATRTEQREEPALLGASHAADATRYCARWVWARDLSDPEEPRRFPARSMGALLRHDEIFGGELE